MMPKLPPAPRRSAVSVTRRRVVFALLLGGLYWSANIHAATEPRGTNGETRAEFGQTPYLQALSPSSMAVLWQTREPAYGWVEYGESGTVTNKQDASLHGLRDANITEHRVVLRGLQPGAKYSYRVGFKPIRKFQAYKVEFGPAQRGELTEFQTLPAARDKVTAHIFNDLHNDTNLFYQLRTAAGETLPDFTIFNGDCFADPAARPPVLATLAAYTRGVAADNRPAFFVRGNHETRAAFARELPSLLAWPENKPYFAFSAGPVRFVVLDLGEDKPDEHPAYFGLVDFARFRKEQTDWLRKEVASREYRKATWRVLVHHIPLYREAATTNATNTRKMIRSRKAETWQDTWRALLKKTDLAINGHTHGRAFHPPHAIGNPYHVVIGGGPKTNTATVMIVDADRRELRLRVLDRAGKEVFPDFVKRR